MPNHIKNVLKFKHLKPNNIDFILNTIATKAEPDEIIYGGHKIDFNKIVPEPRHITECPEFCIATVDSHIEEDSERPWFDWYKWHTTYWGTKWGAYDCFTEIGKSYITFVFSTAWSMPMPIIQKLKLLGFDFELRYADEDLGVNCGKVIYEPSKTGFTDLVHIMDDEIPNPERFAKYLWLTY